MDEFQRQIAEYIRSKSPRNQLEHHREFWGDNPPPEVADLIANVEERLDAGGGWKVSYLLLKLEHLRTLESWNTDPDTIVGERRREQVQEWGNRANSERQREAEARRARWLAEDEKLRIEKPALTSKSRRAEVIRERTGETLSASTIAEALPRR